MARGSSRCTGPRKGSAAAHICRLKNLSAAKSTDLMSMREAQSACQGGDPLQNDADCASAGMQCNPLVEHEAAQQRGIFLAAET